MDTASTVSSSEFSVCLTEEERAQLLTFLEQALRDKQIEVHRTEAFQYRERVQHEEDVLRRLVEKLRRR